MSLNEFFNPTPLYKEYLVLDLIDKDKNITQREISKTVGISLSMVNQYLDEYENKGYIIREYKSTKVVKYLITEKGKERKRVLNIGYLSATQRLYKSAKEETTTFINQIIEKGFKNIIFYGAGEVAEIFLQTINDNNSIPINVVGVVDDDLSKVGKKIVNTTIKDNSIVNNIKHDGVLIASYTNHDQIYKKLISLGYPKNKILYFFNETKSEE
ncbi:winged helix-turn-helix domain-containing protein [Haploplasma axanthum]|uniref:Uncharacterized protein conserved in archaea n=1 Tax=Haploplasma axanthum TaxID=29552 RepID=A0A449BC12_HAPAX|nr:winged helix-turn-helix domain-containing protein [Haploplasma axanthum]VEU79979.1 Uncharacterized protein conserved in archaea [Haploplasma axanthum]